MSHPVFATIGHQFAHIRAPNNRHSCRYSILVQLNEELTMSRPQSLKMFEGSQTYWSSQREASRNWIALGLLLAAWNASDNDLAGSIRRRPESLRGYSQVSVRATALHSEELRATSMENSALGELAEQLNPRSGGVLSDNHCKGHKSVNEL
jgi:hypothetical protein